MPCHSPCYDAPDAGFETTMVAEGMVANLSAASGWIVPAGTQLRIVNPAVAGLDAAFEGSNVAQVLNVPSSVEGIYQDVPEAYMPGVIYQISVWVTNPKAAPSPGFL